MPSLLAMAQESGAIDYAVYTNAEAAYHAAFSNMVLDLERATVGQLPAGFKDRRVMSLRPVLSRFNGWDTAVM